MSPRRQQKTPPARRRGREAASLKAHVPQACSLCSRVRSARVAMAPLEPLGVLGSPRVARDAHTLSPTCPLSFPASLLPRVFLPLGPRPLHVPLFPSSGQAGPGPGPLGDSSSALNPARFPTSPSRSSNKTCNRYTVFLTAVPSRAVVLNVLVTEPRHSAELS